MTSRRGFFTRLGRLAEDPQKLRDKRIADLREWAAECAPLDWSDPQREETARTVEVKLSYLSDDVLEGENMKKYVENIVRTSEMFYAARRAEEDFLRRQGDRSEVYPEVYPYDDNEENG